MGGFLAPRPSTGPVSEQEDPTPALPHKGEGKKKEAGETTRDGPMTCLYRMSGVEDGHAGVPANPRTL